ncbi:MAG: OB-fold nucleic acid binding domain-containing protein [Pseudomonadota bacterium]
MKTIYLPLLAIVILMMSGCASTTPINNLALPPVSTIEGKITQLDESGFILTDNSGSIHVRAKLADNKKLDISIDERVKVYGNLQSGQERIFDGYVIKKSTGEQIIVSNPTPHFGFIIQSSFR